MIDPQALHLLITTEVAEHYCQGVARSARGRAHALAALVAVESFVANLADPGQKAGPGYAAVRQVLREHIDRLQRHLLEESARNLEGALRAQDPQRVAQVHAALSRSGFREAVGRAAQALPAAQRRAAEVWAAGWCREARSRAEAASGCPDAFDFPKAGIDPGLYAALADLEHFLSEQVVIE